jgi:inorganic pyrophosphatase
MPGLEKKAVEITHIYGATEAHEVILRSIEDYKEKFKEHL